MTPRPLVRRFTRRPWHEAYTQQLLCALDRPRTLRTAARRAGLDEATARQVLVELAAAGRVRRVERWQAVAS